jgi:hypothetical protein
MSPRRPPAALLALLLLALALGACGRGDRGDRDRDGTPAIGVKGDEEDAPGNLGFPAFATKNTTRIGGADPVATAAGAALATFPSQTLETRPGAVILADAADWRSVVLASLLAAPPVRGAVLLSDGPDLPAATRSALEVLRPPGAAALGRAQLVRVGRVARVEGLRTIDLQGADAFALGRAVAAFHAAAAGQPSEHVIVVGDRDPAFAMPAAAWAAKSGDAVLFTQRDRLPVQTKRAIAAHERPSIAVLGSPTDVGPAVIRSLRRLGTVQQVGDEDPVKSAVAFARHDEGGIGWGAVDPGHGFTFARRDRPADAAAAAMLATHGSYAPLLLLRHGQALDKAVEGYLLDVQPGYLRDPVRAVYNRGWILGDDEAVTPAVQARIDALLEIQPVADQEPAEEQDTNP